MLNGLSVTSREFFSWLFFHVRKFSGKFLLRNEEQKFSDEQSQPPHRPPERVPFLLMEMKHSLNQISRPLFPVEKILGRMSRSSWIQCHQFSVLLFRWTSRECSRRGFSAYPSPTRFSQESEKTWTRLQCSPNLTKWHFISLGKCCFLEGLGRFCWFFAVETTFLESVVVVAEVQP